MQNKKPYHLIDGRKESCLLSEIWKEKAERCPPQTQVGGQGSGAPWVSVNGCERMPSVDIEVTNEV